MLNPSSIKTLRVHPGLGIARVGNAPGDEDYVLAAEVPGATAYSPDGAFRDSEGRVRRQAVKFRIYAEFQDGSTRELHDGDGDGVSISWSAELANLKAGWYNFENAMDLPAPYAKPASRRNADVQGADRAQLDIRPGVRTICGRNMAGAAYEFASGSYYGQPVYLGELRTDGCGRLIVLGGRGHSAPHIAGTAPTTFANNEGWHDDIADGPVYASVRFANGDRIDAEPGYVAVTPPNFAPGLFGVVTMADTVIDMFERQRGSAPPRPSFTRDVWPIFERMTNSQWVNHGLFMLSGFGSPLNAGDPAVVARLASNAAADATFRRAVFGLFRDPAGRAPTPTAVPGFYGDYYGDYEDMDGDGLAITARMFGQLTAWAEGDFEADWAGVPVLPDFASLGAAEQAAALDRAGLYECLGGPFHPGIELTWFMRVPSLWNAPFRLNIAPLGTPCRQDFGEQLTPAACLAADGPLDGVAAGALTRAMGLPWQTDEASCLSDSEYSPSTYLSFPSFLGARVPNKVLSSQAWARVNSPRSNDSQQLKNFLTREDWLRDLRGGYIAKITMMIEHWWELGILLPQPTGAAASHLGLPPLAWVETGRPAAVTGSNAKARLLALVEGLNHPPLLQAMEAPAPFVPPRRRLRRDEI